MEIRANLMSSEAPLALVLMMNLVVLLLLMRIMVKYLSSVNRLRGIFSSKSSGFIWIHPVWTASRGW